MKQKIAFSLSAFVIMSAITVDAMAQRPGRNFGRECMNPPMHHRGPGKPGFFHNPERARAALGLNDSQVQHIQAINVRFRKQALVIQEKLTPKMIRVKRLLLEDRVNLSRVRTVLEAAAKLRVDLHMLKIRHKIEVDKVLTPEQRSKARSMWMRRGPGRGQEGSGYHRRRPRRR